MRQNDQEIYFEEPKELIFTICFYFVTANGANRGNRNQQPDLHKSLCFGDDAEDYGLWHLWVHQ